MSKSDNPKQLLFDLPLEAASAREDLVVSSSNQTAVSFLDSWPAWPAPIVILAGPVGAGKSHLSHIWSANSNARFLSPSIDDTAPTPEPGNYVVEDVVQGGFSETWLFHLINAVRGSGNTLLLTSRNWPGDWGIVLPDLQSRMKLAHLIELNEPDDLLLRGVLMKLFSDRQLQVEPAVIDYLTLRMERSLASAQALVEAIDGISLVEKRPITRKVATRALQQLGLQQ